MNVEEPRNGLKHDVSEHDAFEFELKFRRPDGWHLERLAPGCRFVREVAQADTYFGHPCRDFKTTDEALRIRETAGTAVLTYKGPRLDGAVKARREIELGVAEGDVPACKALLESLGFRPVATVRKIRQIFALDEPSGLIVALDDVDGLGAYVELEITGGKSEADLARARLLQQAAAWGLTDPEPRSYLELLLAREGRA